MSTLECQPKIGDRVQDIVNGVGTVVRTGKEDPALAQLDWVVVAFDNGPDPAYSTTNPCAVARKELYSHTLLVPTGRKSQAEENAEMRRERPRSLLTNETQRQLAYHYKDLLPMGMSENVENQILGVIEVAIMDTEDRMRAERDQETENEQHADAGPNA